MDDTEQQSEPDDLHSGSTPPDRDADIEAADLRNGEPSATSDHSKAAEHKTGKDQASMNRENDPPA